MLLWLQPTGFVVGGDSPNSSIHQNSTIGTADDGEKGSKIRQRRRQAFGRQLLHILFATTVVVSTMSVFIVKYHHSPKIRGHVSRTTEASTSNVHADPKHMSQHHKHHHHDTKRAGVQEINDHHNEQHEVTFDTLPVNSIYRLSMKDSNGILQSLSQYIGMVTLVVNTACK
jgi:hypothetical protein